MPVKMALFLTKGANCYQKFIGIPSINKSNFLTFKIKSKKFKNIKFKFLNKKLNFVKPFNWEVDGFERLWIFNLHYFDWARDLLDSAIDNKCWDIRENDMNYLIDNWITSNKPGKNDGWHSYTTSLRIRNWIWLFIFCPELSTTKRIKSLWSQICWLRSHPESCHGGNHWIENLTALAQGSCHYEGALSKNIFEYALFNLKIELDKQILNDGGHEERTVSYHILILDRLVELSCVLELKFGKVPNWLIKYIEKMLSWADSVKLINGSFPSFNDCDNSEFKKSEKVISFAKGFLNNYLVDLDGLKGKLLEIIYKKRKVFSKKDKKINKDLNITDLPDTGWTILKPGKGWQLTFKCGLSSPPHLAAHGHSDLLSFNLYHMGKDIITETGTSSYKRGNYRDYERSSAAHNALQIGYKKNNKLIFVEPIDTWSVFRAGKKAIPLKKNYGYLNNWLWVQGSHDGFRFLGCTHIRFIAITIDKFQNPLLLIIDKINVKNRDIFFKSFLHLRPLFFNLDNSKNLDFKFFNSLENCKFISESKKGYISKGFGLRENRTIIENSGEIFNNNCTMITVISNTSLKSECKFNSDNSGKIYFDQFDNISWEIKNDFFILTK